MQWSLAFVKGKSQVKKQSLKLRASQKCTWIVGGSLHTGITSPENIDRRTTG
jgi:hypothetical protein